MSWINKHKQLLLKVANLFLNCILLIGIIVMTIASLFWFCDYDSFVPLFTLCAFLIILACLITFVKCMAGSDLGWLISKVAMSIVIVAIVILNYGLVVNVTGDAWRYNRATANVRPTNLVEWQSCEDSVILFIPPVKEEYLIEVDTPDWKLSAIVSAKLLPYPAINKMRSYLQFYTSDHCRLPVRAIFLRELQALVRDISADWSGRRSDTWLQPYAVRDFEKELRSRLATAGWAFDYFNVGQFKFRDRL